MKFKDKLKKARKEKKLTQAELAKLSDISLRTVINYEKGITMPQNREIYSKLAEILDIDDTYLYNEDEDIKIKKDEGFINTANKKYGRTGKHEAKKLIEDFNALFSGGELSNADKDGVMRALQDLYWKSKEENQGGM